MDVAEKRYFRTYQDARAFADTLPEPYRLTAGLDTTGRCSVEYPYDAHSVPEDPADLIDTDCCQ